MKIFERMSGATEHALMRRCGAVIADTTPLAGTRTQGALCLARLCASNALYLVCTVYKKDAYVYEFLSKRKRFGFMGELFLIKK